jgi:GDPmannose 4,6-dehydratase
LGNLDAKRDWGYAPEYVEGIWQMVTQSDPDDYVLATGEAHSVREFAELAFEQIGITIDWVGEGVEERGIDHGSGRALIEIDPKYFRPSEVDTLRGDPSKAERDLGWKANTSFETLVKRMVKSDIEKLDEDGPVALDYLG